MPTIFDSAEFNDIIRTDYYELYLAEKVKVSEAGSGFIYRAQSQPRIWRGSISIVNNEPRVLRRIENILYQLQEPGNYFNFTPRFHSTPLNYTTQNFSAVSVNGNPTAGNELSLRGVVNNFVMSRGDRFSMEINGVHRLYEVAENATKSSGFLNIKLLNPLTAGALPINYTAVNFIDPKLTCQMVPGSLQGGGFDLEIQDGFSFDFVQAIRLV